MFPKGDRIGKIDNRHFLIEIGAPEKQKRKKKRLQRE